MEITVKRDSTLVKPPVEQLLIYPSRGETEGYQEGSDEGKNSQTLVDGVNVPLIKWGGMVMRANQVRRFRMWNEFAPMCELELIDNFGLMDSAKGVDNKDLLQVQLLPKFDKVYKKINLTFFVYEASIEGGVAYLKGLYYVDGLHDFKLRAFGEKTSYEVLDEISSELKLGLASNLEGTDDKRWLYDPSETYYEYMQEVAKDAMGNKNPVKCWIDYYDNLNIVDLYIISSDYYGPTEVWVQQKVETTDPKLSQTTPVKVPAILTNHGDCSDSQLHYTDYSQVNSSEQIFLNGTDMVYESYNTTNIDSESIYIMDSRGKNKRFTQYEYAGEYFGDFNYLEQRMKNRMFESVCYNPRLHITLETPCFGFYQGMQLEVSHFNNDSFTEEWQESKNETIETDTQFEEEPGDGSYKWVQNKAISGKYYITHIEYNYEMGMKSIRQKLSLMPIDDNKNNTY